MAILLRRLRVRLPPTWKIFPVFLTLFLFTATAATTMVYNPKSPSLMILVLLCLCLYLYFRIIAVGPGTPKGEYHQIARNVEDLEDSIISRSHDIKISKFNHCHKCTVDLPHENDLNGGKTKVFFLKPERAHHCSTCKTCVLKMDHHCPWFACCIGFKNHKSFIQFLLLTNIYALVILVVNVLEVKDEIKSNFEGGPNGPNHLKFQLCYVAFVATIISITLVVFEGYSIYLLVSNLTTIEKMELEDMKDLDNVLLLEEGDSARLSRMNIYDLGSRMANWKQVMGKHWYQWLWFGSSEAESDSNHGFLYPVNRDVILQQRLHDRLSGEHRDH